MMFETHQGVVKETADQIYLSKPQGIFINLKNVKEHQKNTIWDSIGNL